MEYKRSYGLVSRNLRLIERETQWKGDVMSCVDMGRDDTSSITSRKKLEVEMRVFGRVESDDRECIWLMMLDGPAEGGQCDLY